MTIIIIINVNLTLHPNINVYISQLGSAHFNTFSYSLKTCQLGGTPTGAALVPASQDSAIGLGGQNAIARRGSAAEMQSPAAEMQSQAGPARPAMKSPPSF